MSKEQVGKRCRNIWERGRRRGQVKAGMKNPPRVDQARWVGLQQRVES